jgi:hypothetical protein
MLKSVIICTAIATFAIIPQGRAQTPFPGPGPLIGSGAIQGPNSYSDWQQTRRDRGLDYDQDALGHRNSYDPVPRLSNPNNNDYGYHPRDSYDWHHGYDRGE